MNEDILLVLKRAKRVAVLTHEAPDGDAIGSALAMLLVLRKLGIQADAVVQEYPLMFNVLDKIDLFIPETQEDYDVAVALDCASLNRINHKELFLQAKFTINIDHHATNDDFGMYNLVERGGPACCLTLAKLFDDWKVEIDKDIGQALTTGIITDTSGFRYNNVSDTYDFISRMIKIGVDVTKLYYEILTVNTKAQFELKKIAQERLTFYCNDRLAFTYITNEDDLRLGTKTGDHEGIIEIGKDIEGVEVSVFVRDYDGKYRVSLRSNSDVDVSSIAVLFGGGGHKQAAAFVSELPFEELKDTIIQEVSKRL